VRALKFLISIAFAALWAGPTQGQDQKQETIQISPGFTQVLRLDRPIDTVAIGDPDVVDARAQYDRVLLLSAKKAGETNLLLFDRDGNAFYQATISVSGRPALGRVAVHSKPILHRYWAYQCTDVSCWRVKDEFEGPPPEEQQLPRGPSPTAVVAPGSEAPGAPVTREPPQ
jgi:hypothetical protein